MACNFESSNSESTSNESDYDTDEFNENAKVKKQKSETPQRKTSVAKKRVVSGKGKTLGKLKVFSICEEIESNIDTIERDAKVKILNEYAGDFVEMKNVLEREHFNAVFSQITKDFISNYKLKSVGSNKYEQFQLDNFFEINNYLKSGTEKNRLATLLFGEQLYLLSNLFPLIYHIICEQIQYFIVQTLEKRHNDTERDDLIKEDTAQLFRMHGWVLHEFEKKSIGDQKIVQSLKLEDKESLPKYLQMLDYGTKTGLTFPKYEFLTFMRESDKAVRESLSDKNYERYGKNTVQVCKTIVLNDISLEDVFYRAMASCTNCSRDVSNEMFAKWMEKYINIKYKGMLCDAKERMDNHSTKRLTTKTQNLRDKLLTHHVKE